MTTGATAAGRPLVLVVDDEPSEEAFADALRDYDVGAVFAHPEQLTSELLSEADLVVVDQYLDHWPERDARALPPSLDVLDGLGLSAVLRTHTDRSDQRTARPARPVAFALRTGELDALAARLPAAEREHLLASQYDLEWIFAKQGSRAAHVPGVASRTAALARAVVALPRDWGPGTGDPGRTWLRLEGSEWSNAASWQVEQCRPPWHVVADRTTGTAWLRWFLHRILPYPTFLLDRVHAAAALGLTADAFDAVVDAEEPTELTIALDAASYQGQLAGFLGDRWWRAGLTDLTRLLTRRHLPVPEARGEGLDPSVAVDHALEGEPDDAVWDLDDVLELRSADLADLMAAAHGTALAPVAVDRPVLVLDADHDTERVAVDAQDAVRLQPDGWPPFADDAWARRSDLDAAPASALQDLVVSDDRWRLPTQDSEPVP